MLLEESISLVYCNPVYNYVCEEFVKKSKGKVIDLVKWKQSKSCLLTIIKCTVLWFDYRRICKT